VGAEAEKARIPAVSIVSPQFVSFAVTSARAQGVSGIAVSILPYDVMTGQIKEAEEAYEKAAEEIIFGLTQWKPKELKKTREESLAFEGNDYQDAIDNMNQYFLSMMSSDGFPLIPPTKERVDWMLTGTDRHRDRVLTNKFPPRNGLITIEKIAINAAMAGARPEYMPILLAAVEALATDAGAKIVHFLTNSVSNQAPVLIINGPIAKELNINSSYGIMGPGWQANATIGRTISLLLINGAGAYIGPGGNLACQSIPGRYSWCFAENEESNPWKPLHVELGYSAEASTVTVLPGKGTHLIFLQPPVEHILSMIAHAVHGVSAREFGVPWDQLLVLSPSHAQALANAGLSKQDIQNFVFEKARISLAEGEATGFIFRQSPEWAKRIEGITDKEGMMIPKTEKPENLKITVAGGPNCVSSTLIPGLCNMVTENIDKYKPAAWNQLLEAAAKAKSRGPLS
jgi:hypothetical protein